jgi:hypothetical protein
VPPPRHAEKLSVWKKLSFGGAVAEGELSDFLPHAQKKRGCLPTSFPRGRGETGLTQWQLGN